MATAAPITGAPTRAPAFQLNGCTETADEPYPYLDQAHGVLACVESALEDLANEDRGPLNPLLLLAAVRAASTLVHRAAYALDNLDRVRREGH